MNQAADTKPLPLVLLHGWALHSGVWAALTGDRLPAAGLRPLDLPGHGHRRDLALAPTLEEVAADLLDQVDQPAMWLGWSFGGMLALTVARLAPERVTRLILVDTSPKFVQTPDWPHAMSLSTLTRFARDLEKNYGQTLIRFLSLQTGKGDNDRGLLRRLRAIARAHPPPSREALRTGLALLKTADLRPVLGEIQQPTLVIHGQWDRLVPPAAGEYLTVHIPTARMVTMPRAGHAPFISHPEQFQQSIAGFLEEQAT